jgi:hypothetical protein
VSNYIRGLGADEVASPILQLMDERTAEIIRRQKVEERARKIGTLVAISGALFAFLRLGIVSLPHLRRSRAAGSLGELQAIPNPRGGGRRRR